MGEKSKNEGKKVKTDGTEAVVLRMEERMHIVYMAVLCVKV